MTDLTQLEVGSTVRFKGYMRPFPEWRKSALTVGSTYVIARRTPYTSKIWVRNDLGTVTAYCQDMFEIVHLVKVSEGLPAPFRRDVLPKGFSK